MVFYYLTLANMKKKIKELKLILILPTYITGPVGSYKL